MVITEADNEVRSDSADESKDAGEMDSAGEQDEVSKKVKRIITSQLSLEEEQVTDRASFVDDLDVDSLDIVELVMAIEEEFELEIPDEEVEKIRTVHDMTSHIKGKVKNKTA